MQLINEADEENEGKGNVSKPIATFVWKEN
jgi:hypothetical protein